MPGGVHNHPLVHQAQGPLIHERALAPGAQFTRHREDELPGELGVFPALAILDGGPQQLAVLHPGGGRFRRVDLGGQDVGLAAVVPGLAAVAEGLPRAISRRSHNARPSGSGDDAGFEAVDRHGRLMGGPGSIPGAENIGEVAKPRHQCITAPLSFQDAGRTLPPPEDPTHGE